MSEVWQAERWKVFKPSELTPMYSQGLHQFFIEEVSELDSRKTVLPLVWIIQGGVLCADCYDVLPASVSQSSFLMTSQLESNNNVRLGGRLDMMFSWYQHRSFDTTTLTLLNTLTMKSNGPVSDIN
jgi:hypothetical protein